MPIIVNDIDVRAYSASHEDSVLHGVQQFLKVFECCGELLAAVEEVIAENIRSLEMEASKLRMDAHTRRQRLEKEYLQRELMTDEEHYPGEPPEMPIIGMCPKCGKPVGGAFFAACETKRTGKAFYKECTSCPYYSELFKRRKHYEEIEGG